MSRTSPRWFPDVTRGVLWSAAIVVVGVGAFLAGQQNAPARPVTSPRPLPVHPTPVTMPVQAPVLDPAALRAAIREELRAELAALPAAHSGVTPVTPQASAPPPTAEHVAATEKGHRIVSDAVGAKRWTRRDAQALAEQLALMDAEGRRDVLAQLIPAVNRDELRVEVEGPLF